MTQEVLTFDNHDQIRAIFGTQDRYLRRVRESLGIQVVVRGDELRLSGDQEQVETGLKVFRELQAIVSRHGELYQAEVDAVVTRHTHEYRPPERRHSSRSVGGPGISRRFTNGAHQMIDADPVDTSRSSSLSFNGRPARNGGSSMSRVEGRDFHGDRAHGTLPPVRTSRRVEPRTAGQSRYLEAIRENDLVFCIGPAGTGKTFLAVAMALQALRNEQVRKIVLVRPAVEAGEKLGFLPGDLLAKVNPYLRPLLDALADILGFDQVKHYIDNDVIEIIPLAYMRGRTLNDTFIILDEAQNTTVTQIKMFLTRMGENSRIVVTGDPTQVDLPGNVQSGLLDATQRLAGIDGVEAVKLSGQDIVRHRLVREIVRAYDDKSAGDKPSHGGPSGGNPSRH